MGKQYDPAKPLLFTHDIVDPRIKAAAELAAAGHMNEMRALHQATDHWGGLPGRTMAPDKFAASLGAATQAPVVQTAAVQPGPFAKRRKVDIPAENAQRVPVTPPAALQVQAPAPAAGWRRVESRSQAGTYYYYNDATGKTQIEPPPPWVQQESRSQKGVYYYWNTETRATSIDK